MNIIAIENNKSLFIKVVFFVVSKLINLCLKAYAFKMFFAFVLIQSVTIFALMKLLYAK